MSCPTNASFEGSDNISREKLGLFLGFIGMCLFAGTLPATRLAVIRFDPLSFPKIISARSDDAAPTERV